MALSKDEWAAKRGVFPRRLVGVAIFAKTEGQKFMRVLLIEPDAIIAGSLQKRLKEAKISSDVLSDENEAYGASRNTYQPYGAILIGSVETASSLIATIRGERVDTPLVVLSDHRNVEMAIDCFSAGADDFVVKPFNPQELKARLTARARRSAVMPEPTITLGRMTVYTDGRDPEVDGTRIKLSHREHAIFQYLVQNLGRVVSKEAVYTAVYGTIDCEPFEKVIDVYICKLRKKLAEPTGGQQFIETVYCRGYKMDRPENTVVQRLGSGGRKSIARAQSAA